MIEDWNQLMERFGHLCLEDKLRVVTQFDPELKAEVARQLRERGAPNAIAIAEAIQA